MATAPVLRHVLAALTAFASGAAAQHQQVFLNINPSWSPDGRQLVFESARHGNTTLYIINADGTGERRLTSTGSCDDTHPAWSPDGRRIAFDSDRDGSENVYTMTSDGTDVRRLTNGPDRSGHASWSPDGERIVFSSGRDASAAIWTIRPDGADRRA